MGPNLATLSRPESPEGSAPFVPTGAYRGGLEEYGYIEEEWFATGEVDGHPYTTTLIVRRPRDPARFSGVVMVEPWHAMSAAPVWIYTSVYQMRAGHAWACVCSQKSVLDGFIKPSDATRYAATGIWSDEPADPPGVTPLPRDPAAFQARMEHMRRVNVLSTPILAQVGAALKGMGGSGGPFAGLDVRHLILTGHSQTGGVVTDYIVHDGSAYDGFFPSGSPTVRFGPRPAPLIQVLSEGDISNPLRPGREHRGYRRDDSDEPGDRYRLYELAGLGHMGTRYPPYNDPAMWQNDPVGTAGQVPAEATMNSLPHSELFQMALHHLVRWVADGVTPPRAERIEVGPDELFVKDEHGNSKGGVRCAQMDVPRARYLPNPGVGDDGIPAFGVVGIEEPLPKPTLARLYKDHFDYVDRFNRRVDELIRDGWLLPEDGPEMRAEAEKAGVP